MGPAEVVVVSSEAEVVHPEADSEQREVEQMLSEVVPEHMEVVLALQVEAAAEPEFMLSARSRQMPYPMQLLVRFSILVLLYLYWLIAGPHIVSFPGE